MTVGSFLPLPGTAVSGNKPQVNLLCGTEHGLPPFPASGATCVYTNPASCGDDPAEVEFHRSGRWFCLRYPHYVEFYFSLEGTVFCYPQERATESILQSLFLGPCCAVWLELRGVPCLHASAVAVDDRAMAIAGNTGCGKSTLAAWLVAGNVALLADDIVALRADGPRCFALPGYPQMKLSPEAFDSLPKEAKCQPHGTLGGKYLVSVGNRWGRFAGDAVPLDVIYVLHHDGGDSPTARIEALSSKESFTELLRLGFCVRLVSALGLAAQRFEKLTRIANRVMVCRLHLPKDLARLGEIRQILLDDFARRTQVLPPVSDVRRS